MSDKIKVGMIGAGRMAVFHLEVLSSFDDVDIVALSNTRRGEQRRKEIGDKFNIKNRYDDYKKMLEVEQLDAVFICASVEKMFEVSKECLLKGINSFIEKPPGLYVEETQELLDIARKNKLVNMVGLQRRFYSHIQHAMDLILKKGSLVSIVVEAPERFVQIKDKGKFSEKSLSRWIFANGIHCLDMLPFIGGNIKKVSSSVRSWQETVHPDSLHAMVEFESGVVGHYYSNWMSPGGWSVKIYGEGYRVDLQPMEKGTIYYSDGSEEALPIDQKDKDFKPGVYAQDRVFIDACKNKDKVSHPAADLENALETMKLAQDILNK